MNICTTVGFKIGLVEERVKSGMVISGKTLDELHQLGGNRTVAEILHQSVKTLAELKKI